MATIRLKYVHSFLDRHGHPRHYFRRNGKCIAMNGEPGSAEFMDAYAAALAEQPSPPPKRGPVVKRSFRELATIYYGSAHYLSLSQSTKRSYRSILDKFLEAHGHRRVDQFQREHIVKIIGAVAETPSAAAILLKRIRTLTRFALDLGWIRVDPTHRVRSFRPNEIHTWTEDELAEFEACWPVGTKQRLGFALHLYTGQRGSDVHRMTWRDVAGDVIHVVQMKTGAKLAITLHPTLQAVLSVTPKAHVAILTTEYGKPFSVKGFGNYMSTAIRKAGLPARCKAHGLRKAAARRLAEAGCSAKQIMAVTGHKTLAEVERYTAEAEQAALNREAIAKQVGNTKSQPDDDRLATLGQKP